MLISKKNVNLFSITNLSLTCVVLLLLFTINSQAVDNSYNLDFDGDGKTDIAVYRDGAHTFDYPPSYWYILNSSSGTVSTIQFGRALDIPTPADYDNDGKTDTAIYRWWHVDENDSYDTNQWWINQSTGGYYVQFFGNSVFKYSRDYFGDGRAEIAELQEFDVNNDPTNPCYQGFFFAAQPDGFFLNQSVSPNGCEQGILIGAPGDYDNDGKSEAAVFVKHFQQSSSNYFRVWNSLLNNPTPDIIQPLDVEVPAPGDYDGDGQTDFAGYKFVSGNLIWVIKESTTGNLQQIQFGLTDDKPVPGDYDGDGKTDLAVFRPSDSTWWIKRSSDGVINTYTFGLSTDDPLAFPNYQFVF